MPDPAALIAEWELALANGLAVITPGLIQRTLTMIQQLRDERDEAEKLAIERHNWGLDQYMRAEDAAGRATLKALAEQDAQYRDTP